ncbi:MAG: FtsX-like permease family protein, partial [Traorella sp.]
MKKIYLDILREIRKSIGRFISIFAIVAIGVAFFAGIKASSPLMKETADEYFDEYNLQDIQIYSTLGFVDEDIEKIREVEGVEGVHATHSMDALFKLDTKEYVYKVMTIPKDYREDNPDYINQAVLVEGRMPENENECLIEVGEIATVGIQIGQIIDLYSGTDTPIEDSLNTTHLEVVGLVKIPYYLSYQKGSSSIGDGSLDGFLLVFDDNFKSDIYTEVYVSVAGSKAYNSYDDEYFEECIDPVRKKLVKLANERASLRTDEVKAMALEELAKKEAEFEAQKQDALQQLKDAEKQLQNAYEEIKYNESYIRDLENTISTVSDKLNSEINAAKTQLEILKTQQILGENSATVKELEKMLEDINSQIEQIDEEDRNLDNEIYFELKVRQQTILVLIEVSSSEAAQEELAKAIQAQEDLIQRLQDELNSTVSAYEKELASGKTQIEEGLIQYEAGLDEYNKNKLIVEEELNDAQEKLDKAREDIENMSEGEWYVLDRKSHYSYMDYGAAADRMDNIAKIFPVFFFLVAALICLTTMTRMVDEQRGVIGTLKALGYSKGSIAIRYLSYAFISSICGCVVGVLVGFAVFPTLIVHLWNMMYTVPDAGFKFYGDLALLASGSCI